jgi:copper resistance protein B
MRALLPILLPLAVATPALAQTADPHAGHDMSGMTMAPASQAPTQTSAPTKPADPHAGHDMSGMAMPGMTMGPPETPTSADDTGRPPRQPTPAAALIGPAHAADRYFNPTAMAAAREAMKAENGDVRTTGVVIDRLEAGFGDGDATYLWDAQGWTGGDINRFWWKSEGEGGSTLEETEVQALYSRAIRPFWDLQAGVRQTIRPDLEDTTDLVLGVQGLAPHWFEIDAAAFLSTEGDLSARIEAEYDQRLTQRWILQPRAEVTVAASDVPEIEVGAGLSSLELGLRLRYEIRREFAPYAGVEWSRRFGETRDLTGEAEDIRFVVGLRTWF